MNRSTTWRACPHCGVGVPVAARRCQACSEPIEYRYPLGLFLALCGVAAFVMFVLPFLLGAAH